MTGECEKTIEDGNWIRLQPDHDFVEVTKRHLIRSGWLLYCRKCGQMIDRISATTVSEPGGDL